MPPKTTRDVSLLSFLRRHSGKLIAVALVFLGAVVFLLTRGPSEEEANTRLITVETGTIEDVVTSQGKLEPKEYVDVGTQVSGQIKALHVEIGDDVAKSDLLAEIDPRIYESKVEADTAELKSLQAQLAEQQANLNLARQLHKRNDLLIKSNAISKQEYDESAASLKTAEARVNTQAADIEKVQSTLKGDQTNLSYTKIFAPMAGTVATLPARLGQTLNANQTAPLLMQIANLDIMTVRAQVAEADVMRLSVGMKVHFTTLGNLERRWDAQVRQILPSPELINDVVLFNVLIDVENKDRALMNGMSTQIFFELGKAEDVAVVPVEALGKRMAEKDSETGKAYEVQVKKGKRAETRIVQTGMSDRTRVAVLGGLQAGEILEVASRKPAAGTGGRRSGNVPPGMGGPRL